MEKIESPSNTKSAKNFMTVDSIEHPKSSAGCSNPKKLKKISKLKKNKKNAYVSNNKFEMCPTKKLKSQIEESKNTFARVEENSCMVINGPASSQNLVDYPIFRELSD